MSLGGTAPLPPTFRAITKTSWSRQRSYRAAVKEASVELLKAWSLISEASYVRHRDSSLPIMVEHSLQVEGLRTTAIAHLGLA